MQQHPSILFYASKRETYVLELERLNTTIKTISWVRLGVGLVILLTAYMSFGNRQFSWGLLPELIIFGVLVNVHARRNRRRELLQHLIDINDAEIRAQEGDISTYDSGAEYVDPHHPYTHDLDVFGPSSFFQHINRTSTEMGKDRLAQMLSVPLKSAEEIRERQESIKELSTKADFRQLFQAIGKLSKEKREDKRKLLEWLNLETIVYGNNVLTAALIVMPVLSFLAAIYWFVTDSATPFVVVSLVELSIIGSYAKRVVLFQNYIGDKRHLLETFSNHFELIRDEVLQTPLVAKLKSNSVEACDAVSQLAKRSRALDLRMNVFAFLLFNTTMLYDLLCVYRLERWRERHRHHLAGWLQAIEEFDALNSAATFSFNNPEYVFPTVIQELVLSAKGLGHPLLRKSERIPNDVMMTEEAGVWIVTGANMAGKSTFLRTVGLNMTIALAGLPVCAEEFSCPTLEIYSGMRTTDSISDHQSYFFAELLRLQTIMSQFRQGKKLMVLLDEILKGTNSSDKLTGSQALVRQLVQASGLCIVATHDVALGEMANEYATVRNYHFETFIQGDDLSFDYKLKPGISTGKNATFLMKKMGIIA